MHMSGFVWGPHTECLAFLVQGWRLDSPLKFYGAVVGSTMFGVFYEATSYIRYHGLRPAALRYTHPRLWRVAMASLFVLQLCCGYLLMLIVMAYQLELFLASVAGVGVGHYCFNVDSPSAASVDPCCPDNSESPPKHAGGGGGGGIGMAMQALRVPLLSSEAASAASLPGTPPSQRAPMMTTPRGRTPSFTDQVTLRVDGMVCEHCSADVEAALSGVVGVVSAVVDLSRKQATVHGTASAAALVAAVSATGKQAMLLPSAVTTASMRAPLLKQPGRRARRSFEPMEGAESTWLALEGMTCNGCRDKVEVALKEVSLVYSAEVDLDARLARVHHTTEGSVTLASMLQAVERTGYAAAPATAASVAAFEQARQAAARSAPDHTVVLELSGMSCAACASKVEHAISKLDGVRTVSVSLLANSGKVDFEPSRVGLPELLAAVESLGFRALPRGGTDDSAAIVPQSQVEETRQWRRSFVGSLTVTVPIVLLSMVLPMTPLGPSLRTSLVRGLSYRVALLWALATIAQGVYGARFYVSARAALAHGVTNMDTLVALGTAMAYFYSVLSVTINIVDGGDGAILDADAAQAAEDQQAFETGAMLLTFILLGKYLESAAKRKAAEAISKLLSLQPSVALLCECVTDVDSVPREVEVSSLVRGDVYKALPGMQLVLDGVVLRGTSEV